MGRGSYVRRRPSAYFCGYSAIIVGRPGSAGTGVVFVNSAADRRHHGCDVRDTRNDRYRHSDSCVSGPAGTCPACSELVPNAFSPGCVTDSDATMVKGAGTVFTTVGVGGESLYDANNSDSEAGYFATTAGLETTRASVSVGLQHLGAGHQSRNLRPAPWPGYLRPGLSPRRRQFFQPACHFIQPSHCCSGHGPEPPRPGGDRRLPRNGGLLLRDTIEALTEHARASLDLPDRARARRD